LGSDKFPAILALAQVSCYHIGVIQSFRDAGTEDIFNGKNTKAARQSCPDSIRKVTARKLDLLDSVISLNDLRVPPGNRLEALSRERTGQHSIRINDQYRICFVWTQQGPADVEIVDYH
jgi:proteic killer suppression protein